MYNIPLAIDRMLDLTGYTHHGGDSIYEGRDCIEEVVILPDGCRMKIIIVTER